MKAWALMHMAPGSMPWRKKLTSTVLMHWSLKLVMQSSHAGGGDPLSHSPSVEDKRPLGECRAYHEEALHPLGAQVLP